MLLLGRFPIFPAVLTAFALCACGGNRPPGPASANDGQVEDSTPIEPVTGNPFEGVELFNPPYTNADQARRRFEKTNAEQGRLIGKIADTPQARWFGEWSGEIETVAHNYVKAASNKHKVALLVAYNVPNRDCGQYSAGGATGAELYRDWIDRLAKGIGPSRRAIVILEPDALGHLTHCLSEEAQRERLALIREATTKLGALPGVSVYIDAGHSRWVDAETMAERLKQAGVSDARGFALNVSNYIETEELVEYGNRIVQLLASDAHFVIDTSRNGNGPPEAGEGESTWCNPEGRALGPKPTTVTGHSAVDAFAWIKNPGESDGTCNGGPDAGQWFEARALEMARNAKW